MKKFIKRSIFILIGFFIFNFQPVSATGSLTNVSLDIQPHTVGSLSAWTISFTLPETTMVGHVLISLGGYQPGLANATLTVSGLSGGTQKVGKSNPNCVFNCDDIRYYFNAPVQVKKGTNIVFTLNNVKNSDKLGQTGINFIDVFSSPYPQMTLAYSSAEKLVELTEIGNLPDENLIPETATSEEGTTIQQVVINQLFYQAGARTTRLSAIKDATKVNDFTLDLLGKVRATFKGTLDLSKSEAVHFIANLTDYMTFDYLSFKAAKELMDYFKVPIELTFYDLPYIWTPDVLKNDQTVLTKDNLDNYHLSIYDDKTQLAFIIKEAGSYKIIPHFELYITDNQLINTESNSASFSGRISDPKAIIKISLNGKGLDNLKPQIDPNTGEFSFNLELIGGANLIEASAQSDFGQVNKITRIVQYQPLSTGKVQEKPGISPFNIIAIGLAVLAIILIVALRYLVKKK